MKFMLTIMRLITAQLDVNAVLIEEDRICMPKRFNTKSDCRYQCIIHEKDYILQPWQEKLF